MKTYFRLLSFARPFKHYIPEYIIYVIPSIVFGALNFTLLIPLFDMLFNANPTTTIPQTPEFSFSITYFKDLYNYTVNHLIISYGKITALEIICGIILLSVFFSNLFRYLSLRILNRLRTWSVYNMRKALFGKLSTLHLGYYSHQQKGNLMSVISADTHEIENSIANSVTILFRDPLTIVVYITLLFTMSARLTLFTLVFFPIAAGIIATITKRLRKESILSQNLLGRIMNVTDETIGGNRIIKAFSAQKFMQKRFDAFNSDYRRTVKSASNKRDVASPLSEVLGVFIVIAVMVYGGSLVLSHESDLKASVFVAFIALYSQMIPPIKNISTAVTSIQRGLAAGDRVLKIIDTENEIKDLPSAETLERFSRSIDFKNVNFAYNTEEVIKNVSFSIPKGKMVALVGQSGAGKSTMADLLCRFYDPQQGCIEIDGKDIKNYTLKSLRDQMGVVTQEAILFNDSVFNNIAFGMPDASMEDVMQAAKIANAHEFIEQLEQGYKTNIGDRGLRLSGGQRQRISIARAVLKNPPILVLDEATSALDTESEKLVQEAIQNLMQNRTSMVIAHRLSTIQHADEIIVMQQGEIMERGTHETLYAQKGVYRKLCDMQSFA